MIYRLLFVRPYPIRPLCRDRRYFEDAETARQPGLGPAMPFLRASRLLHREAVAVLYGQNALLVYGLDFGDSVVDFLKLIGRPARDAIRAHELDWQHGIIEVNQASKARALFAMVSDRTNPLREHVARMLHDVGRTTIRKFVAALELLVGCPNLEHLSIVCPGNDNPTHPDKACDEYQGCSGCRHEVPRVLRQMRGLKSLTVGDTDWYLELEALAAEMEVQELHVSRLDCIDMSPETLKEYEDQGWTMAVTWRDPDGEHFRRVASKRMIDDDGRTLTRMRQWW